VNALRAGTALRIKLALVAPALHAASGRLWEPPGLRDRYARYLQAMHFVLRASVPLMERAAGRCAAAGPADPVAGPLGRYLARHADEERGHEDWLARDLAALAGDPVLALEVVPPPTAARLVGPASYWADYYHPVALLGYIAVLEGNAPAPGLADWIAERAGVPATAVSTVREHAALDLAHGEEVLRLLDALPLTGAQAQAVSVVALHTAGALIGLLASLTEQTAVPATRSPASGRPWKEAAE
jgi:hypothetical protein